MKKVHNTRSNNEEMITVPQKTIHTETGVKIPVSPDIASSSTIGLTSSDWLEIMEGFDMEGSGNLYDGQSEATNIVRNLASPASSDRSEILQYIRDQFEAIYQDELVDIEAKEALTDNLSSVSQQQNKALIKEISLQKITDTIDRLPNYKAASSDGLTYKFY
ncbi:27154_t:CDS:2 [Gigaspora margarita]|uniref:27154_t:CDS:1 n=1 Tax=Gigaspora margarita TaxID=4874 RepID=A0ABN7VEU1_GIGMA|nr:27154_t:CDS:2 [Gigaspora margarita]